MKKTTLFAYFCVLMTLISFLNCATTKNSADKNDWITLFNGKDIKDWIVKIHHHEVGDNYGNTFRVEDGLVKVRYDNTTSSMSVLGICILRNRTRFII